MVLTHPVMFSVVFVRRVCTYLETHEVSAVAGLDAWLPCNVTSSNSGDDEERPVALILWYKDNSSTPVYTVDARSGSLLQGARHFPGEDEVAARLSFDAGQQPAVLRVSRVEAEDAGVYRCRVDYRQARTENTWSTLRVIAWFGFVSGFKVVFPLVSVKMTGGGGTMYAIPDEDELLAVHLEDSQWKWETLLKWL
ncbi:hypothetical protein HPB48_002405 [Haemaphysalis longicornis]|uniref:Ig-like domain-containing protein n=1 Tax=Haemaphysalis longicornis TaxID=44386 RepID=A0A9J6FZ89_HAELO|nr:hypothetical protein HPB48_002405 [Haemaphysalis longicornis]